VRAVVVGAGAWGLPAAAELSRRGHDVTLVEAYDVGHPYGSSSGESRLWRVSHPDRLMVRLALRSVEAWRRVERLSGTQLLLRRGLLWRGDSAGAVADALGSEGVAYEHIAAKDVAGVFPGLRPNGSDAVWQADAGPVLAAQSLQAHLDLFVRSDGRLLSGHRVVNIDLSGDGVQLGLDGAATPLAADVVVVAPGPWAGELLPSLGVELDLEPVLEQVAYLKGRPGWEDLPCVYDGAMGADMGLYAMPTPGMGYKIGLDLPLRSFLPTDLDRAPDPGRDRVVERRVARDFAALEPTVLSSQVCTWTMSPDGRFVIERLHGGRVVLACGDSGTGFKFSALMGEILADLAEGKAADADVEAFGLARFAGGVRPRPPYGVFGQPPGSRPSIAG
jgi:sarcosine oxidase